MRWNLQIFKKVLPRHFELILMIDHFFVSHLKSHESIKNDPNAIRRLQIIEWDAKEQQIVRIPHFCFVASTNIFNMSCQ